MFLGAWASYTNQIMQLPDFRDASPVVDQLPEINRLIFAHVTPSEVFDHAGLSGFFFNNSFPQARWEFNDEWNARAESLKLYRFDLITIADRKSGHMGGGFGKPMDRAFELPVPKRWVSDLKDRLLRNYKGPVSLEDPSHAHSKPVITYLSRQTAAHRHLREDVHDALVVGLKEFEKEGIAEVNIEEFTDADPKDEQVAKLSRTTIFVSLHGNGLTNLIWMTPDAYGRSTAYEIQQKGMFMDDYAVLSEALGMEHRILGGRSEDRE
ncbi:hypothetical protein QFC20_000848 [Naganishia adeliensis]|uniref:Uncharacterized protein n=1 Tax=Naganishia adeliensis TaxID=92952 RepID=A0ACC2WWM3_9TREE|nr:hypothetical protein QFC20_000848 [Naganishia adeliensis]